MQFPKISLVALSFLSTVSTISGDETLDNWCGNGNSAWSPLKVFKDYVKACGGTLASDAWCGNIPEGESVTQHIKDCGGVSNSTAIKGWCDNNFDNNVTSPVNLATWVYECSPPGCKIFTDVTTIDGRPKDYLPACGGSFDKEYVYDPCAGGLYCFADGTPKWCCDVPKKDRAGATWVGWEGTPCKKEDGSAYVCASSGYRAFGGALAATLVTIATPFLLA